VQGTISIAPSICRLTPDFAQETFGSAKESRNGSWREDFSKSFSEAENPRQLSFQMSRLDKAQK
jgi:hypothetical protein